MKKLPTLSIFSTTEVSGTICIFFTVNNTILSLVNSRGLILFTSSCGYFHYKGAKKKTDVASKQSIFFFARKVVKLGYYRVFVKLKGFGNSNTRSLAVNVLIKAGLRIVYVFDVTSISYNGCRVRKSKK